MTSTITIVGLGPGPASGMTVEARQAIDDAPILFLRTLEHPAAREIAAVRTCDSFDGAYTAHAAFEEVKKEAEKLGFKKCIIPQGNLKGLNQKFDLKITGVKNVGETLNLMLT